MKLNESQKQRVLDNLCLVDYIIQKRMHIYLNNQYYEDYQQEGRLGLILATMRYDDSKGYEFSTYAAIYIEGYIRRYNREFLDRYVHIPRRIIDLRYKIVNLYYEGYTPKEIIDKLNIKEDQYYDVISTLFISSINAPIAKDSEGNDLYLSDVIGKEDESIKDILGEERVADLIERVANNYKNEKHKAIWYEYAYSSYQGEKLDQRYLASKYGYPQSHISRILSKGKKILRSYIEE